MARSSDASGSAAARASRSFLAALAGVNAQGLVQTLAQVAQMSQGQGQDALGRQRFVRALSSPFKASWVTGALSHTQGGLLTRPDGGELRTPRGEAAAWLRGKK